MRARVYGTHHLHEDAKGSLKRKLDLLELKLQVVVSQHVAELPGPQDDQQVLLTPDLSLCSSWYLN